MTKPDPRYPRSERTIPGGFTRRQMAGVTGGGLVGGLSLAELLSLMKGWLGVGG